MVFRLILGLETLDKGHWIAKIFFVIRNARRFRCDGAKQLFRQFFRSPRRRSLRNERRQRRTYRMFGQFRCKKRIRSRRIRYLSRHLSQQARQPLNQSVTEKTRPVGWFPHRSTYLLAEIMATKLKSKESEHLQTPLKFDIESRGFVLESPRLDRSFRKRIKKLGDMTGNKIETLLSSVQFKVYDIIHPLWFLWHKSPTNPNDPIS